GAVRAAGRRTGLGVRERWARPPVPARWSPASWPCAACGGSPGGSAVGVECGAASVRHVEDRNLVTSVAVDIGADADEPDEAPSLHRPHLGPSASATGKHPAGSMPGDQFVDPLQSVDFALREARLAGIGVHGRAPRGTVMTVALGFFSLTLTPLAVRSYRTCAPCWTTTLDSPCRCNSSASSCSIGIRNGSGRRFTSNISNKPMTAPSMSEWLSG